VVGGNGSGLCPLAGSISCAERSGYDIGTLVDLASSVHRLTRLLVRPVEFTDELRVVSS
jgi:hypothetical protein